MIKAKYQMIADEIREQVQLGNFPTGLPILTEMQLQKKYEVSRHTVRQAIGLLVNEGYLYSEKGSGTYADDKYKQRNNRASEVKTIGVITTYVSDYIFPAIIRGIERKVSKNGFSLLLSSTNNEVVIEKDCLERMMNQKIDGLIVEPTKSNELNPNLPYYLLLQEKEIPVVMINAFYEEFPLPTVRVDDVEGGFLATNYLLKMGHEKIICLMKTDDLQGKYRLKGFIKAHALNKVTYDSEQIFTYITENYQEVVHKLLIEIKANPSITGLVCYNDEVAQEIMIRLRDMDISVPEQLSIVGNDDSSLSESSAFQLTTISHPKDQLGERAAMMLLKGISKQKMVDEIIVPKLIVRNTVKNRNK